MFTIIYLHERHHVIAWHLEIHLLSKGLDGLFRMDVYKVNIEKNEPVSATLVGFPKRGEIRNYSPLEDENGNINWLAVLGHDEQDSMEEARNILKHFWPKTSSVSLQQMLAEAAYYLLSPQ
jgi:hypothetical protein